MTPGSIRSTHGAPRPRHGLRVAIQVLVALVVTLPAVLNAAAGRSSFMSAALVFAVVLSAVWVVSAVGVWAMSTPRRPGAARPSPSDSMISAHGPVGSTTSRSQPLARVPVVRVPADQAQHADVDGNVTAATSTMGAVR